MNQQGMTLLTGATVLTPQGWLDNATVLVERGRIVDIQRDLPPNFLFSREDVAVVSLSPDVLMTPGLIDIQINGGYGVNFGQASIPGIQQLLGQMPRHGVTGLLATLVTAPVMDMMTAINTMEETLHIAKLNQTRLLGIHLEGPVLNPARKGAHPADCMLPCDSEDLTLLLSPHVRLMTLAPEMDPAGKLLDVLRQHNIIPMAGHTQASLLQLQQAHEQGLAGLTHLYNAMEGYHHRKSGTALHALNMSSLKASIIADGQHVHPDILRLTQQVKGVNNLLLISDAMPLAGTPEGTQCQFAGQSAVHRHGQAVNPDGTLAGSVQMLDQAVRNMVQWGVSTLEEAITMASANPARLLGLQADYGQLAPGCKADLVLWDRDKLSILATWIEGSLRWAATKNGLPAPQASLPDRPMATC